MKLHASGEDYLETILVLQKKFGMVRSVDVARHMEVSKPSVCHAVATLRDGGFLTMDSDYFLHLTEIKAYGIRYLRVIFIGSLFVNFTQSANMVMRGEGLMKKAMMIMGLGALLNIILDPILMTVMGEYAIEGAALATITAQFVQAVATLHYFLKKSKVVKIHKIKSDPEIKKEMFGVGSSAMMMQLLFMIQQTMLYKMAFKYGGDTNGILMAASLRVYAFSFIPLWGMSQGLQPVVGTNFGAKQYLSLIHI